MSVSESPDKWYRDALEREVAHSKECGCFLWHLWLVWSRADRRFFGRDCCENGVLPMTKYVRFYDMDFGCDVQCKISDLVLDTALVLGGVTPDMVSALMFDGVRLVSQRTSERHLPESEWTETREEAQQ